MIFDHDGITKIFDAFQEYAGSIYILMHSNMMVDLIYGGI